MSGKQTDQKSIFRVERVTRTFRSGSNVLSWLGIRKQQTVHAVEDVTIDVRRGEIFALIGESGSGKSTLARTAVGLVPATRGKVFLDDIELTGIGKSQLRRARRRMQMIGQDGQASLSPRMTVAELLTEPYTIHRVAGDERKSAAELLSLVGLAPSLAAKKPHALSGGQARRVSIARALATFPEFIIADEPTAGLDPSAAANVMNLLLDIRETLNVSYLIITHSLDMVGGLADRIAVMYLGRIVEIGPAEAVLNQPVHPYTQALVAAVAVPDPSDRASVRRNLLSGEVPSASSPPSGCRFHTRCQHARTHCREAIPEFDEVSPDHSVACHRWEELGKPIERTSI